MPLAYYSRSATTEFWSDHWRGHSVDALLSTAHTSPLTDLILRALPAPGARVLEAGCGLGSYVVLLRQRGYRATGADWSLDALRACRAAAPGTPLGVMDLRQLGFRSGAFAVYISLGVVEHDPEGPDSIVREARRVLAPGGVLILSVPYVNLVRRLCARWIRRRHRRLQGNGGEFYQFAFSRVEAQAFIERNGFRVLSAIPYDPARALRRSWRTLIRMFRIGSTSRACITPGTDGGSIDGASPRAMSRPSGARNTLRRLLYTRAGLHALGHMILFVAMKR